VLGGGHLLAWWHPLACLVAVTVITVAATAMTVGSLNADTHLNAGNLEMAGGSLLLRKCMFPEKRLQNRSNRTAVHAAAADGPLDRDGQVLRLMAGPHGWSAFILHFGVRVLEMFFGLLMCVCACVKCLRGLLAGCTSSSPPARGGTRACTCLSVFWQHTQRG
jgi:hypothetical protein